MAVSDRSEKGSCMQTGLDLQQILSTVPYESTVRRNECKASEMQSIRKSIQENRSACHGFKPQPFSPHGQLQHSFPQLISAHSLPISPTQILRSVLYDRWSARKLTCSLRKACGAEAASIGGSTGTFRVVGGSGVVPHAWEGAGIRCSSLP